MTLNVNMPVMGGFQAARHIKATFPELAIVILSSDADQRLIDEAKKIGVRAYVAKTKAGEELIRTIEAAVARSDFVLVSLNAAISALRLRGDAFNRKNSWANVGNA